MSFSSDTKEEVSRLPIESQCCIFQELGALLQTSATLSLKGRGQFEIEFRLESGALARRVFLLLRSGLQITPTIYYILNPRLGGQKSTILLLKHENAIKLLLALNMLSDKSSGEEKQKEDKETKGKQIKGKKTEGNKYESNKYEAQVYQLERMTPRIIINKQCCRRAFLRGAFLGAGSVTNPEKGYHLEITARKEGFRKSLLDAMKKSGIEGKKTTRKGNLVIYLKESNQIVDFLGLIGAYKALTTMEEVRVQKEIFNKINRMMNCDQHNLEKQLDASQKQIKAIKLLAKEKGLNTLPPSLQSMARMRLEHPDASLLQLGEMMDPPIGKSGVNHRLRKIQQMAENIPNYSKNNKQDI